MDILSASPQPKITVAALVTMSKERFDRLYVLISNAGAMPIGPVTELAVEDWMEVADLFSMRKFMVHFALRNQVQDLEEPVPVELECFGEDTEEFLTKRLYPVYSETRFEVDKSLPGDEPDHEPISDPEYQQALSKQSGNGDREQKGDLSDNPAVRLCQELTDMPKVLAERLYEEYQQNEASK